MKLAQEHDCVLCVESGKPGDGVVVNRPSVGRLQIEVKGLAAHASNPEEGRNAAVELAYQILKLSRLEDKEKGTNLTTRMIESGTGNLKKAVVPDRAVGVVNFRAYTPEELHRVEAAINNMDQNTLIPGIEVKTTITTLFPVFAKSEKTMKLARLAQGIYNELGLNLQASSAAPASDANFTSSVNEATIDSLGPVSGGKNHTEEEWADATTVIPRLYLLTRMLMELGSRGL
ncbi:MAG TPA: peptidase dimerization domain-containing protein [Negativicutes bacterium]|nr:peptidase dimerization domain-containing protein [Negativicutes bacterium]